MTQMIRQMLDAFFHTRLGYHTIRALVAATQYRVFAARTVHAMRFDALRLRARNRQPKRGTITPPHTGLHVGCGKRHVPGWLNVDVAGSEQDVDLACGSLPWRDGSFDRVVSQQVIEHLDLMSELVPLFRELRRVCKPGAEFWMACPDLATTCRAYDQDRAAALLADRDGRCIADSGIEDIPTQHFINMQFQQFGEHKNLLDLELIEWLCRKTGFGQITQIAEADMMARFPEFPYRNDNLPSIYVRAVAV